MVETATTEEARVGGVDGCPGGWVLVTMPTAGGPLEAQVLADVAAVVDAAGMPEYRRHHCGYLVGIGFPPSWTGGNKVTGLRHDSDLEIRTGMTFHAMSWFTGTGRGDYFVSNTVLLGPDGAEVLTRAPLGPRVV